MDENQNKQFEPLSNQNTVEPAGQTATIQPVPTATPAAVSLSATESIFHKINRVTALVLVFCAILFAVVSILSIWQVFGDEAGEIVWRSLSSLATIAFAALVINVATKLIEGKNK